jgi:hypothetical protein
VFALSLALSTMGTAQENSAAPHDHDMRQSSPQDNMQGMNMDEHASFELPSPHEGSGTSWQPASVSEHEWMWMRGGWELWRMALFSSTTTRNVGREAQARRSR